MHWEIFFLFLEDSREFYITRNLLEIFKLAIPSLVKNLSLVPQLTGKKTDRESNSIRVIMIMVKILKIKVKLGYFLQRNKFS